MKYLFDINNVNLVNLNNVDRKKELEKAEGIPFYKIIGNFINENTSDLDMVALSLKIHKGECIEMSEREKELFSGIIGKLGGTLSTFLQRQILAEIKTME